MAGCPPPHSVTAGHRVRGKQTNKDTNNEFAKFSDYFNVTVDNGINKPNRSSYEMTTLVHIHLIEKYTHPVYGRIFDGYVEEAKNVFGSSSTMCAMTEDRANRWVSEIETRAREWPNATKHIWSEEARAFVPSFSKLETTLVRA